MADEMLPPVVAQLQGDISDFKEKMGSAKGEMGDVEREGRSKFSALGSAIAGGLAIGAAAVAGFAASSIARFGDVAGQIDDLQDVTGESAESLSKMRYAFTSWGVDADTMQKSLLKLSKEVGKGSEVFEQYSIATTDAQGNTLPMTEIVKNAADVFQSMPDGIEKSNLAMKLFGKNGTELLDVMSAGRAGLEGLGDEAERFGLVLGQDDVDAAQANAKAGRQMHAAWEGLQLQLGKYLMPVLAKVTGWIADHLPAGIALAKQGFEKLRPVIDFVSNALSWLGDYIGSLVSAFKDGGISEVIHTAFEKWREIWPKIVEFLGNLAEKAWSWVKEVVPPLLSELGNLLAALGGWLWDTGLPLLVTKLGEWGRAFIDWIGPKIPPLLAKLGDLLKQLGSWLVDTGLPTLGSKLAEWGKALLEWIGPRIVPMLEKLAELLGKLGDWLLTTALPAIVQKLLEWGKAFIEWIGPQIPPLLLKLGELLASLGNWLLTTALPAIVTKLGEWALAFVGWVGKIWVDLNLKLLGLIGDILGWIGDKALTLGSKLGDWVGAFTGWITDVITDLPLKLLGVLTTITSWITGAIATIASTFAGVASAIGSGIITAIKGAWNAVANFWNKNIASWAGFTVPGWIPVFGGKYLGVPTLPTLAVGGEILRGGRVVVGEYGAEVVDLPAGAAVYPHGTVPASDQPAGQHFEQHLHFEGITDVTQLATTASSSLAWLVKTGAA